MQRDLSQLTRELQKETCPRRVLDEVQRRVSADGHSPGWTRGLISAVATVLVLACCILIWRWPAGGNMQQSADSRARTLQNRVQIANQAAVAMELIGSIAAKAGAQSGKDISDHTLPPLLNSLQAAENKINRHIKL